MWNECEFVNNNVCYITGYASITWGYSGYWFSLYADYG
jgi:hypothetical protein